MSEKYFNVAQVFYDIGLSWSWANYHAFIHGRSTVPCVYRSGLQSPPYTTQEYMSQAINDNGEQSVLPAFIANVNVQSDFYYVAADVLWEKGISYTYDSINHQIVIKGKGFTPDFLTWDNKSMISQATLTAMESQWNNPVAGPWLPPELKVDPNPNPEFIVPPDLPGGGLETPPPSPPPNSPPSGTTQFQSDNNVIQLDAHFKLLGLGFRKIGEFIQNELKG